MGTIKKFYEPTFPKYLKFRKPEGDFGYFKRRRAIKDHECDICHDSILESEEYYAERYPTWLPRLIRDYHFDQLKICHKCACEISDK